MLGNFDYVRVRSIAEGCRLLARGDARVLAGGTDLLVDIRNAARSPSLLVDIKGIEDLSQLTVAETEEIVIGAAVPLNAIVENSLVRSRLPGVADAALSIATYQVRNRATVVGNLCNASPAADMGPILLVLNAEILVSGSTGERTIPVAEFFTGAKQNALNEDEIAVSVRVPDVEKVRTGFLKQQRIRGHDLAVVSVAGAYSLSTRSLRLAVGSCASTPRLLDPIDAGSCPAAVVDHAVHTVDEAIAPVSDVRATADYRRAAVSVLTRRLVERLLDEERGA